MSLKNLFKPIKLGKLEVRNRVVFAPIGIGAYNDDETVNENYFPFIAERAKETGLIITQGTRPSLKGGNQLRLMLSTLGYVLIDGLRRLGLDGTEWARRQAGTLRVSLLKIGAVIVRNTRRVVVHLSSSWPGRDHFLLVHARLRAG